MTTEAPFRAEWQQLPTQPVKFAWRFMAGIRMLGTMVLNSMEHAQMLEWSREVGLATTSLQVGSNDTGQATR